MNITLDTLAADLPVVAHGAYKYREIVIPAGDYTDASSAVAQEAAYVARTSITGVSTAEKALALRFQSPRHFRRAANVWADAASLPRPRRTSGPRTKAVAPEAAVAVLNALGVKLTKKQAETLAAAAAAATPAVVAPEATPEADGEKAVA
jgi:hypothetical protein